MSPPQDLQRVAQALSGIIHGRPGAIDLLLIGVLGGGHVLIEDVPGVGKTTLAKALARAFGVRFTRVQFTPDLLPTDILGSQVLNPRDGSFAFHRGPIFTNVLLADEINRASPRTQSALLEAMNEAQATIDGVTHPLPQPFFVLATQNPVDYQGTYPLPEAQLDRFLLRISVGYPAPEAELRMLLERQRRDPLDALTPVTEPGRLAELQAEARAVEVREDVARYVLRLVGRTRDHKDLELGASPRASLALFRAAQARALLRGRRYVSPEDVQALAAPVLGHRVRLTQGARYGGAQPGALIEDLLRGVEVPA